MPDFSTRTTIHKRLSKFVTWIAPDPDKKEDTKKQADEVRTKMTAKLVADGYVIAESPYSGSYGKKTGLRRHMLGDSEVEGQDIDIAFIFEKKKQDGTKIAEKRLVDVLVQFVEECYPSSSVSRTKSSARLDFVGTKLSYDLVPLVKTNKLHIQELHRTDGDVRTTSVIRHAEFSKNRTKKSDELKGRVKFNECVRLLKWWRTNCQAQSKNFGNGKDDKKIKSFLLDLLCAKAFDVRGVEETYAPTLAGWFGYLANVIKNREPVVFNDYISTKVAKGPEWVVLDPMDFDNNIVSGMPAYEIDELARWFREASDIMVRAITQDEQGKDSASLDSLVQLFGNSFRNNCN